MSALEPDDSQTSTDAATMVLPWKYVALGCSLLAMAATSALIIITATTDAGVLSSVALILAVLAFSIQIIVVVADFSISARREREASALNAATQVLLSKIEAKANTTNQVVTEQLGKLLDGLVLKEKKASREEGDSVRSDARLEVIDDIRESLRRSSVPDLRIPDTPTLARANAVGRWPNARVTENVAKEGLLEKLSGEVRSNLLTLAEDIRDSYKNSIREGLGFHDHEQDAKASLLAARLVRPSDDDFFVLTNRGLEFARFLSAPDPVPVRVSSLMPWLESARAEARELASRME
jgi:hypothetical protein